MTSLCSTTQVGCVDRWAFPHSEAGWLMTLDRLRRHGTADDLPVSIERTSGLVVDRLLSAGHPVVPVHPTAFFAARPRWGASGAKSDPGDSYKLADYLRTDGHRLRRLSPLDAGLQELQALVRLRDDQVVRARPRLNQLTALLDAHWPGPRESVRLAGVADRLGVPDRLPDSGCRPRISAKPGWPAFLRRHPYRGGKTAAELLARLRAAPVAPVGLPTATLAAMITAQVQLLQTLHQLISDTERLIAARVVAHPRTALLAELPGVGVINLAQLLAEVGPILDRVDSAEQAATECGAAPVTRASGKTTRRLLPVGGQHPCPKGDHQLRSQRPTARPLGRQALRQCPRPRETASARHPHPRSSLASGDLGLLASPAYDPARRRPGLTPAGSSAATPPERRRGQGGAPHG